MQTLPTRDAAVAGLLIGLFVGLFVQPVAAQSVHRTKVQIVAGPTVQVSQAFPSLTHGENLAAGDLEHAGRLITCSMVFPDDAYKAFVIHQQCYASFDSGKTWEPVLKLTEGWGDQDPVATYGRGDDVYVVTLVARDPDKPKDPDPDAPPQHEDDTVVYKSTDGGHTWREVSRLDPIDREFINVDTTNGKYTGRIYVVGQGSVKDVARGEARYSLKMWRSLDNGRTFLGPIHAAYPQGSILCGVGTGAVLSDGTLVALFGFTKSGRDQNLEQEPTVGPNVELHVITSKDGGDTFSPSHKIADVKLDRQRSEGGILNQLTADPGSKAFKDRLYVVYPEIVSDRIQIRASYSSDKGKTWSKPMTVNDDRSPEKGGKGPDHLLPSVGVNRDGVVLVTWYDRREAKDNLGWRMRAAASLDGGETFSASVPITDFANAYAATTRWHLALAGSSDDKTSLVSLSAGFGPFFTSGGHTSGLAVDADGSFHPTWVDNHTGIAQLWSASVKVEGAAVEHGAPDLAGLKDISKSVTLELSKPEFDRVKGTLSVLARLKNISKDTVEGPVKVRVLTLESDLGVPEITNADNGQDGTGAVWDFTAQLSGAPLASMKLSAARTLSFRVSDLRPLAQGKDFKRNVLNLDTRILGKLQKAKGDKDEDKDSEEDGENRQATVGSAPRRSEP